MNLRNILLPLGGVALIGFGFYAYGWAGVAAVAGGLVMWALLHFTRLVNVMKKAAKRPIGYVGSAVMLNARLAEGVNLMHVVAMTQALGELRSPEGADPEVYRWTDGTQSHVTCEFRQGKLVKWVLFRPDADGATPDERKSPEAP
ncbi:glycerate kinase [Acidovorax radicis]|uniref:glycerate kinase n=1 Tax=Acidovorax radicis TaxID=758826 RepID=UPI001CF93FFE|nr:glycerate kinase [Acidovorax radicis]UCU99503.1 glycerate kinase [Acidovorax radicis]